MRFWIPAAVGAYFLFFFHLTGMGMIGPDEPRYAWIGREMARSGDWVTPRLWGEPWFEKPALPYWMTAAAFRLGLGDDLAPRLPVACLSVVFLVFFHWRIRAEFGARSAGYGSAVLATSAGWVAYSHAAVFDLPLAATFGAAMLGFLAWIDRRDERWLLFFAAFLGLSMLAKGLVGPAVASLAVLCFSTRAVRDLARPGPVLAFVVVAAPWYVLCYARNGRVFLEEFFWKHHVSRFVAGALEHNQPVWFFVPVLAVGLLPWTPLVAVLGRAELWRDRRLRFLGVWAAVTLVFFSISRDKLPAYVLPALPAIAALAGVALAQEARLRFVLPLAGLTLGLMPAASAMLPEALDAGLWRALEHAQFPALSLAGGIVAALMVWTLERAGRRPAAFALIALAAVAGYAWIEQSAFPAIDRRAGARALWQKAQQHGDLVCVGDVPRGVAYGLNYYAGRPLPECEKEPQPYRIEDGEIRFDF
ncbi:MAG: glycosyltransferase family 39 protein [Acidobacteria bacterium]|nr:glycosyltransferase family 39 protein [Acidobacteriota bacterium]